MFGIVKKKDAQRKTVYTLLANCSYSFLKFEDEEMKTSLWENRFTGKIIRFHDEDGTIEPVHA